MSKIIPVAILIFGMIYGTSAFWGLDTDFQLGYEIYDRCYEINSEIQAIATAASKSFVIQNDDATKAAVAGLSNIASQLRYSPINWFYQIYFAASSRSYNEVWHFDRIKMLYVNHNAALNFLLNATGPLSSFNEIANPILTVGIRLSLVRVQVVSAKFLLLAEGITKSITKAKSNSSFVLNPETLGNSIGPQLSDQVRSSLIEIRDSFVTLLAAVKDVGRLVVARGSIYDILTRSDAKDTLARNNALANFNNQFNRVKSNLITSVSSYRQAAITGIQSFISRVQSMYDDTVVRPKFDNAQLPLIRAFSDVIATRVYNQKLFETSFDRVRETIASTFTNATRKIVPQIVEYRKAVLDLQQLSFVRRYSPCLDKLVTEAQVATTTISGKYNFCLDERTSGVLVVIPSTSTWFAAIRDNVNFILQQLNSCLNGQTTMLARTATSNCIQANVNNLVFYSSYLPITVEANLRPVVESPPIIFNNCIRPFVNTVESTKFNAVYAKCKAELN